MITKISPNSFLLLVLHVMHLLLLLVLHHLGLGWLLSFHLTLFHLLLFHLLVTDHFHLMAAFRFLDLLLLLHHHWIRLHINGNNESSKSVTADDTAIEHNILGSHLANKIKMGVISNGCFKFEVTKIRLPIILSSCSYIYSLYGSLNCWADGPGLFMRRAGRAENSYWPYGCCT